MFELHPKTKKLLDCFVAADYGTEFSYAEIRQKTECDLMEGDRQRIYTVRRRLERDHQRTLMNQRGRGYKIARPGEHVDSAQVSMGKAKRQVSLAKSTLDATPLDLLNDVELKTHADQMVFNSQVVQALKFQSMWNSSQDDRIAAIEGELRSLRGRRNLEVIEGEAVDESQAAERTYAAPRNVS